MLSTVNNVKLSLVSDIVDRLKAANKKWGHSVYEDQPPNSDILPVIQVYSTTIKECVTGNGKGLGIFDGYVSVSLWTKSNINKYMSEIYEVIKLVPSYSEMQNVINRIEGETTHITMDFYFI